MAVTLTNSLEGGTNGTGITAGNSGGASGNAFDAVTGGGSITYSNVTAAHGVLSAEVANASNQAYAAWRASLTATSIATVWFRVYCYLTANPPSLWTVMRPESGSAARAAEFGVTASGNIQALNQSGASVHTGSATVPLSTWFRIEGFCTGSATVGQVSWNLYNVKDSTSPTETYTSAATVNTLGTITGIGYGTVRNITQTAWIDDLGASDTTYLGPVVPFVPPVVYSMRMFP